MLPKHSFSTVSAALLGLFLTACISLLQYYSNQDAIEEHFQSDARQTFEQFEEQFRDYEQILSSISALLNSHENALSSGEAARLTNRFLQELYIRSKFSGLYALALVERVKPENINQFLTEMRELYGDDFDLISLDKNPLHHGDHWVVTSIYPQENSAAIGLDLSSEPRRMAGIARAVLTRSFATSPPINLVQKDIANKSGNIIYLPIISNDGSIRRLADAATSALTIVNELNRASDSSHHGLLFSWIDADSQECTVRFILGKGEIPCDAVNHHDDDYVFEAHSNLPNGNIIITPTLDYLIHQSSISTRVVVGLGLLMTIIFSFFIAWLNRQRDILSETIQDRTKVIEAKNQALEIALSQANIAIRAKRLFLQKMSHELLTPLNGVLGMIQAAQMQANSEVNSKLNLAKKSAKHLQSLLDTLLVGSAIDKKEITFHFDHFSIPEFIEEVTNLGEMLLLEKSVEFSLEISPELPDYLYSDPKRLKQILFNMLSNAAKFTHEGKVTLTINYRAFTNRRNQLILSVQDTGVGIEKEKLQHIFELFEQADNEFTRTFDGAGLGLFIAKNLIEAMGGSIHVDSEINQGSTFTVILPMATLEQA